MRATVALTSEARPVGLTSEAEEGLLAVFREWKAT
jgi:hypothetical protein